MASHSKMQTVAPKTREEDYVEAIPAVTGKSSHKRAICPHCYAVLTAFRVEGHIDAKHAAEKKANPGLTKLDRVPLRLVKFDPNKHRIVKVQVPIVEAVEPRPPVVEVVQPAVVRASCGPSCSCAPVIASHPPSSSKSIETIECSDSSDSSDEDRDQGQNSNSASLVPSGERRKVRRRQEAEVRDRLLSKLGESYVAEKRCALGRIDLFSEKERTIIEVKNWSKFSHALGQILMYSRLFPGYHRRVHFFGTPPSKEVLAEIFMAYMECGVVISQEPNV